MTNLVSTISFRYDALPAEPSVRKVNPLGFQVVDYRTDIDQGGALK
jgi:type IV secretory pathway component VirB8